MQFFGTSIAEFTIVLETGRKLGTPSISRTSTAKQDAALLLNKLPDDCSIEDIPHHLYVLDKVRRGLDDARMSATLSQEVEARLHQWLA